MNSKSTRRVLTIATVSTLLTASIASAASPSDFNRSGSVGLEDLQAFFSAYYSANISADANGDGKLSYQDIFTFSQQWVKAYSQPRPNGESRGDLSRPATDSVN